MKTRILAFGIFLCLMWQIGCPKPSPKAEEGKSANSKNPSPNFAKAFTYSARFEPELNQIIVDVALEDGFHVYGVGEPVGKPVGLAVTGRNGWIALNEAILPKGSVKPLDFQKEAVVISGKFSVSLQVTGGSGPVEAKLYMQVCTDQMCDRPREHIITIDTESH